MNLPRRNFERENNKFESIQLYSRLKMKGKQAWTMHYCLKWNSAYATSEGFSITGKNEDLLPCYNAMLIEAYSKLGYGDRQGLGITKYGGCMKSTPCYIGIAKSVKALIYYSNNSIVQDEQVIRKIKKGKDYLLQHNMYQRISNNDGFISFDQRGRKGEWVSYFLEKYLSQMT